MSDENKQGCGTWPEQNAVDEWAEKHNLKLSFSAKMELKKTVSEYRIELQKQLEELKCPSQACTGDVKRATLLLEEGLGDWRQPALLKHKVELALIALTPAVSDESSSEDGQSDGESDLVDEFHRVMLCLIKNKPVKNLDEFIVRITKALTSTKNISKQALSNVQPVVSSELVDRKDQANDKNTKS